MISEGNQNETETSGTFPENICFPEKENLVLGPKQGKFTQIH